MNLEIQNQLTELEFLARKHEFIDDFEMLYTKMLAECLLLKNRGTGKRMKAILTGQVEFLTSELTKAAVEEGILQ